MEKIQQKTILLVEDEFLIALAESRMIKNFGYDVVIAHSGEKAVESASENPDISLVLMDIDLGGGIDGPEAAKQILDKRSIPIVFLTSHSEKDYVDRVKEITRYGYVIKNSGDFVLKSSIEMAFELHESEEKYRSAFLISPDSININTMDGRYVDINEGFLRMTGYSREEVIGKLSSELHIWEHPADRERLIQGLKTQGMVENLEAEFRTKNGSIKTCLMSARIITFKNTPHILSITRDITEIKHKNEEIAKSEEIHKKMVSNISDVIAIMKIDGTIKYKSPNIEKWFGWKPEDLVGTNGWDTVHPDDLERIRKEFFSLLESDNAQRKVIYRYKCKDGSYKLISLTAVNLVNDSDINGVLMNYHDITERKQVEDTLRESEERFKNAFVYSALGMALISPDGRWLKVNSKVCSITGYSEKELSSMTFQDITHPEDINNELANLRKLGSGDIDSYTTEKRYIHKNGKIVWISLTVTVVRASSGKPLYYVSQIEDCTDRKKTLNELQELYHFNQQIIQCAHEGIIVYDKDLRYKVWNPYMESVSGLSASEVIGKHPQELFPFLRESKVLDDLERALKGEVTPSRDVPAVFKPTGETMWRADMSCPLRNAKGEVIGVIGIVRDITEQKKIQDMLRESHTELKAIFESVGTGIIIVDQETQTIVEANAAAVEMCGFPKEKMMGRVCYSVLCPAQLGTCPVKDFGQSVDHSVRKLQCADGRQKDILKSVKSITIKGRACYIESFIDISDRRAMEERLREKDRNFSALFNSMLEAFALHEIICDSNGKPIDYRFLDVNPAFEKMTGLKSADVIGKSIKDVLPGIEPVWIDRYGEVALTGESIRFESFTRSLNRYFQVAAFCPQKNQFAAIFTDITERKLTEETIIRSQRLLKEMGRIAKIGAFETDLITRRSDWTEEVYHIYEVESSFVPEIEKILEFYTPNTRKTIREKLNHTIYSGKPFEEEAEIHTAKGNRRWVYISGQLVYTDEKLSRIVGVIQDITERKLSEKDLERERAFVSMIMETSPVGIVTVDTVGNITYANTRAEQILGLTKNEITSRSYDAPLWRHIGIDGNPFPDEKQPFFLVKNTLRSVYNVQHGISWPDGRIVFLSINASPMFDGSKEFAGMVATIEDITEQKESKEILLQNQRLLMEMGAITRSGAWKLDTRTQQVEWTEGLYSIYELDSSTPPTLNNIMDFYLPKSREILIQAVKGILENGTPYDLELEIVTAKGTHRWIRVAGRAGYTEGKLTHRMGTVQDITEQKRIEERLKESELKYRSFIEHSSDVVFGVDENGEYRFVNQVFASTFGKAPEYFIGKTFWDIYPKEHADFRQATNKKVFETGESESIEVVVPLSDRTLYYLAKANPLKDETGKVLMNLTHAIDITERKLAEEKVKILLTEKEILLKEVQHRIKNNMLTMQSLLSLQAQNAKDPAVLMALKDAQNRFKTMGVLYERLFRTENLKEMSVKDYLPSLVQEISAMFPRSPMVSIETNIEDFILGVKELSSLGIIINELITNSMKYAFEGKERGSISVKASKKENQVTICVADDGIGLPDSVDLENSTGFGLKLVNALMMQLNGTVQIEREKGTKFILGFHQ